MKIKILVIFLSMPVLLQGQKYYSAFAQMDAGFTVTYGDVKRYDFAPATNGYIGIQPGVQAKVGVFMNEYTGMQIDAHFSMLSGHNPEKNLQFLSRNGSASVKFKMSFNSFIEDSFHERLAGRLKAFFDFGYGMLFYDTEVQKFKKQEPVELDEDSYRSGRSSGKTGVFPIALTVMYKLNKYDIAFWQRQKDRIYLTLSGGLHFTGSDLLDGFEGRDFGNDTYGFYSVGVAYFFGR